MPSRRQFIQMGAVALPLAASPALALAASLPPSIAGLKSMRDQAKPITREERAERQQRARRLMQENGLDAILLADGTSLTYFTGIRWWGSERFFAFILPARGEAFYVSPAFEEGRAREQIQNAPGGDQVDLRTWHEDENPYQRLAEGLKDRNLSTATLGMEETVRFVFADAVGKVAPQVRISSATPVTAGCRMIKSAHELDLMHLASRVTLAAYAAAYRAVHDGMTQQQLKDLIEQAHQRLGFEGEADAQTGPHSANPHGSLEPQVIHEGTIVLIDGGCRVEGYVSDISRTFVLGKPTDKMKHIFDIVHSAQSAALKAARPGEACGSVDAAARQVITDAGFGPDYKFFGHRVGHGMGMDGHEWPYLVRGNPQKLAPNMTFSDEPGIYLRGEFGVRLEDDMHITNDGAELFTPQSPSLEDPFHGV
jgi:Xaa-Pro dipeptidase